MSDVGQVMRSDIGVSCDIKSLATCTGERERQRE